SKIVALWCIFLPNGASFPLFLIWIRASIIGLISLYWTSLQLYCKNQCFIIHRDFFLFQNPNHQPELILSLSLPELCQQLGDGSLTPESVFYTYVDKALKVTADVNCIIDYIAENESQLLHMNSKGKKGLLYGVPISIKDSINCKGYDTTLGFVKRLFQPAAEDAVIVQVLKHQGAIPFVKTNIPQSLLNYDCSNPIFGSTVNPLNPTKSPGGSSGGEGALIKNGGSILGIGTDIAGSIRLPSAFCGICGLKTTSNRIRLLFKCFLFTCFLLPVFVGLGPMARDVDSLALCLKALLCKKMFHLDPTVPPLPFNEQVYTSSGRLRIGYHVTNSYSMPNPSMIRAVLETKELLEINGHVVCILIRGEADICCTKGLSFRRQHHTVFLVLLITASCSGELNSHLISLLFFVCTEITSNTILYNYLDFPAGVVPVTTVTKEDEEELKNFKGHFNDLGDKLFAKAVKESVGLPVAIQCVALPLQEELCLRFMKEVEKLTREKSRKQ
uniref:Fatty-acid amide hydrolase 1 n=1 Tax=Naja naja TaxID=35670 RepID=A0A8C6XH15_NAJNA